MTVRVKGEKHTPSRFVGGIILEDGTIQSGAADFTVSHDKTGMYEIIFEPMFDVHPACIATLISGDTNAHVTLRQITTLTCQIEIRDSSGQAVDRRFSFIALGGIGYAAYVLNEFFENEGKKPGAVDPSQIIETNILTVGDHAEFSATIVELPYEAQGNVSICNKTTALQTLIGDAADGIPNFTIRPDITCILCFRRAGTFTAHLKGSTSIPSANTTLMIIVPPSAMQ